MKTKRNKTKYYEKSGKRDPHTDTSIMPTIDRDSNEYNRSKPKRMGD